MKKKTVLITGVAGFIGSNLAIRCIREGYHVIGVDNLRSGREEFVHDDVEFFRVSFNDEIILNMINKELIDVVFHLAAIPRVGYSVEHVIETNQVNVQDTLELINACVGKIKRFVFASSSSVYGGALQRPTPPSYPKDPKSPYALQKSVIEDYLKIYYDLHNLDSVSLRFFNVFGPHQTPDGAYSQVISAWLAAVHSQERMRSDGDGTQSRDMCHVDNVVDALIRAGQPHGYLRIPKGKNMGAYELGAMQLNVACGESVTNNEIKEWFIKTYGLKSEEGHDWYAAPKRAGDVKHTLADISKTRLILGYEPKVLFWEGLEQTAKWFAKWWEDHK